MYVVTGATGNTGKIAARELLRRGEKVRVIGRSAERLRALATEGAEPFVADLTNAAALTQAFTGARAVYAMIPPDVANPDVLGYARRVADSLAEAIQKAGVPRVVALSSFGADKDSGTGPVLSVHYLELRLNRIPDLNVLYLRAGYFMENTLGQAGIIQNMGITAGPLRADLKLPMIATRDIGAAAAAAMVSADFTGAQTRELLGQRDITYKEVAAIIGRAIGKPELAYVQLPNEQLRGALLGMGMSPDFADKLLEMSASLNNGDMRPLETRTGQNTTPTSYETFVAEEFVPRFRETQTSAA